jgi:hypothetical protein
MLNWKQNKLNATISNSLILWLIVIDYTSKSEILTYQNQRLEIQTNLTFHWQQSEQSTNLGLFRMIEEY